MTDEYAAIIIAIGGKGHLDEKTLRKMQAAPAMALERHPDASIMLMIDGYDDDTRELWQIPQVVRFIRRYAKAAGLFDWRSELFEALDETSKGLLIACSAIELPHPFTLQMDM